MKEMSSLKVLFLSSDTGGGHRASAESLANQFKILFPGSTYDLLDVVAKDNVPPFNKLVESYKHLSAHPQQWNLIYKFSNTKAYEFVFDVSQKALCEKAMRKSIMEYNPDVVVSVHPLMTNVPVLCCQNISEKTGKHLPIFTVVTDLGSAHCLWFCNGVDKMFIASDEIRHLAKVRGKVPDEKLVQIGLPIRHQFAEEAEKLGNRMSPEGKEYQRKVRAELDLPVVDRKTILIMGGGEGVGSLSNIVDALYVEFMEQGIDALILVVCGRNEKLKNDLATRDWTTVVKKYHEVKERRVARSINDFSLASCVTGTGSVMAGTPMGCMDASVTQQIKKILSTTSLKGLSKENAVGAPELMKPEEVASVISVENEVLHNNLTAMNEAMNESMEDRDESLSENDMNAEPRNLIDTDLDIEEQDRENEDQKAPSDEEIEMIFDTKVSSSAPRQGRIEVVGLGFVTKMADYMVAADVLVSKAGPGTIAEAAALSLPVMLTSFLPGQEEGNVDFVLKGGFGTFVSDSDPKGIAEEVATWLTNEEQLTKLSEKAKICGAPNAARDIVQQIGSLSLKWKKINEEKEKLELAAKQLKLGIIPQDEAEQVA